jgi:signal transduction histidine kinase
MLFLDWWRRWGDFAFAAAFTVAAEYQFWFGLPTPVVGVAGRAPVAVCVGLVTVPLAWRRSHPTAVVLGTTAAFLAGGLLVANQVSHGPLAVFVALLIAFYSVGAHGDDRSGSTAVGIALVAVVGLDLLRGVFDGNGRAQPLAWLVLAFAALVGRDVRRRRREIVRLRERADRLEGEREERARRAVLEERARIARELHDVVAHGVSVMVVQAQAGPLLLSDGDRVRDTFRSIEAVGREALVDLRRLLGILRTGDESLAVGPQPGLDSLTSLVEQVRGSGLTVDMQVEGEPVPLPPGVDLSAYRIVQEALTNTIKHAGRARSHVLLRYDHQMIEIEVVDDGSALDGDPSGSGHGLIGMRERVALYGGSLEAGRRSDGGYLVRARLPLTGAPVR